MLGESDTSISEVLGETLLFSLEWNVIQPLNNTIQLYFIQDVRPIEKKHRDLSSFFSFPFIAMSLSGVHGNCHTLDEERFDSSMECSIPVSRYKVSLTSSFQSSLHCTKERKKAFYLAQGYSSSCRSDLVFALHSLLMELDVD